MTWPVILLNGPLCNQTLSTIKFDKFGTTTSQEIYVCDTWEQGFEWAKQSDHLHALFVRSGTLFRDWIEWKNLVDSYPHQGLIGHIIAKPEQHTCLNDQCWFIELKYFSLADLTASTIQHPQVRRSQQNIHDDYTPLWIRAGSGQISYTSDNFGQGLLAQQLSNNRSVVNWNQQSRGIKSFCYDGQVDLSQFRDYKNIAESQLWVLNNEPISILDKPIIVAPGSGLFWITNIANPKTEQCIVVDISKSQVQFAKELWEHWDGVDYGEFAWQFIVRNKVVHYQIDKCDLTSIEKLQMKSKTKFIDYVNTKFNELVPANFQSLWQFAKQNKSAFFYNDNIINWVVSNNITPNHAVWRSNILDYKWTLLHSTPDQYREFTHKLT